MPDTNKNNSSTGSQDAPVSRYCAYAKASKGTHVNLPLYRVIPAGKAFYHVVEIATDRVIGYRRHHVDACALAQQLEARVGDDTSRIRANSGA